MTFRFGIGWLERTFLGTFEDDTDARDWLAGDDAAIRNRKQARARDQLILAGGEIA